MMIELKQGMLFGKEWFLTIEKEQSKIRKASFDYKVLFYYGESRHWITTFTDYSDKEIRTMKRDIFSLFKDFDPIKYFEEYRKGDIADSKVTIEELEKQYEEVYAEQEQYKRYLEESEDEDTKEDYQFEIDRCEYTIQDLERDIKFEKEWLEESIILSLEDYIKIH
jgi:hypothetical protein